MIYACKSPLTNVSVAVVTDNSHVSVSNEAAVTTVFVPVYPDVSVSPSPLFGGTHGRSRQ